MGNQESYYQPIDDGLSLRPSGLWVMEKLHYVQKYIDMFTTSMRNKPWRKTRYIDLFSGPGKCIIRETAEVVLGSPIIALSAKYPFGDYVFVDKCKKNIDTLRRRCALSIDNMDIHFYCEDGNTRVVNLVNEIEQYDNLYIKGLWSSLNLAFLDPEGLELRWETIETLASVRKMDLIIHYPQSGLTRNMEKCYKKSEDTIIDHFFGSRDWRKIYKNERMKSIGVAGTHRALIDYYKDKLHSLGYVEVQTLGQDEPLVRTSRTRSPLYRLLFASKNKLGHDFWDKVTQRDAYGQERLI